MYVAIEPDTMVSGCALLDFVTSPVRLRSIATHTDFQRRGIGKALIARRIAETNGDLDLWVKPDNHGARKLYERMGFVIDRAQLGDAGQDVMRLLR